MTDLQLRRIPRQMVQVEIPEAGEDIGLHPDDRLDQLLSALGVGELRAGLPAADAAQPVALAIVARLQDGVTMRAAPPRVGHVGHPQLRLLRHAPEPPRQRPHVADQTVLRRLERVVHDARVQFGLPLREDRRAGGRAEPV
jgi:hypothetical protein